MNKASRTPDGQFPAVDVAQQQESVTNIIAAVALIYFMGTSFFPGYNAIEAGWGFLLALLLILCKPVFFVPIATLYFAFFTFFLLGAALDQTGNSSLVFLRTLASWTIFSTFLFCALQGAGRRFTGFPMASISFRPLHLVGILGVFLWSISSLRQLAEGSVIDFRDFTGQNYLVVADLFAMLAISFLLRPGVSSLVFIAVSGCALATLFFLSSRTSLVFFPIALLLMVGRQVRLSTFLLFAVPVLVASGVYFVGQFGGETLNMTRVTALLELSSDQSATSRSQFRENALTRINQSPSCLIVPCHPEHGMYDHSVFSVVEFFGLMGIAFLLVSAAACVCLWRRILRSWYLPLFVFCFLSLLFSRSWLSAAFPVGVALLFDVIARSMNWTGQPNPRSSEAPSRPSQPRAE